MLNKVQLAIGDALQLSYIALYRIVAAVGVRRSTSHSALFQAMFHVNTVDLNALEETSYHVDEPTIKVDLEMQLFHCNGEVAGRLIYDAALYDAASVRWWLRLYELLLAHVVETPETPLQELLRDGSQHVLWTFNDTAAALPLNQCIHDLMAAQVMATPQAVALDWHGDTMTYGELMECATMVSAWVCSSGFVPDLAHV